MKQLLFILIIVLTFVSCKKENNKHVYCVTFTYPSTSMLTNGDVHRIETRMETKYLGIVNDYSILNNLIDNKRNEFERDSQRRLKRYASLNPDICKHKSTLYNSTDEYIKKLKKEIKSSSEMSVLRSFIGQYSIIIVLSDSLLNSVDGDYERILKDYDKAYKELCQVYKIYDGVELASTLETEYLDAWYDKQY